MLIDLRKDKLLKMLAAMRDIAAGGSNIASSAGIVKPRAGGDDSLHHRANALVTEHTSSLGERAKQSTTDLPVAKILMRVRAAVDEKLSVDNGVTAQDEQHE